jgi:CheY-like chemotaxis protein
MYSSPRSSPEQATQPVQLQSRGWAIVQNGAVVGFVLHENVAPYAPVDTSGRVLGQTSDRHEEIRTEHRPQAITTTREIKRPVDESAQLGPLVVQDKIMRYAVNELLNSMHALAASANSVMESMAQVEVDPEVRQDLQDIGFAAHNTQVLVTDILTMNKLKEGALVSTPELVDIRMSLKQCIAHVRPVTKVPIVLSVAPSVPLFINIDIASISQMVANALVLAAKHCTPDGDPIHVAVYKAASTSIGALGVGLGQLVLEIMDAGNVGLGGLSGDQLMEALSTPEDRVIRGARAQRMTLFLPIAKVLATSMNGSIRVEEVRCTSSHGVATSVVRVCICIPYTEPTDAEARRFRDELGSTSSLHDEHDGVNTAVLPLPFAAATKSTELGTGTGTGVSGGRGGSSGTRSQGLVSGDSGSSPRRAILLPEAPLQAEEKAARRHGRGKTIVGLDGHPLEMNVLLVDDSGVIRRQGENFLEQLGCTCISLEDGDQVQQALASALRPFDAILMDIVMHRSDGAFVCRDLRDRLGVKCPIIAMTGNTKSADLQRYYLMGFDVVLPKPFTRESLGRVLLEGRER